MEVVYEDNHIIVVNKKSGEITQGDKTGNLPLSDIVKAYIKEKYQKPGNVFLGVVHRLDRPVTGLVLFARTSKALPRLNKMFLTHEVRKIYWAIVPKQWNKPIMGSAPMIGKTVEENLSIQELASGKKITLINWLVRNEKQNKSYAYDHEVPNSKKAILDCRIIAEGDRYALAEVELHTGRHHQIRCQLAAIGYPIKGDLKYGSPRSNPDGSISLHSRHLEFVHPVSKEIISLDAPLPDDRLWQSLSDLQHTKIIV